MTIGSSVPPSHTSNPLNTLNIFAPPESALQRLQHISHCHYSILYQSNPPKYFFAQACWRTWYICPTKTKVEFHYQLANFEFSTFTNTTEIRCFWKVFMPYFLLPHRPSKYCKVSLLPSPSESLGALRRTRKTLQWREDVAQPSGHRNCHHKEGKTT